MKTKPFHPAVSNRIVWADLLRLVAIFMVICIHCSDPFNVSPGARSNPDYNFWGSLYGAFLRPCVPLFVMLTGMLLLPVQQDTGLFYRKRMLRIIVPFLIWSVVYNLFPCLTGLAGGDSSVLSRMFAYAGENPSQWWESCWRNICMIPFQLFRLHHSFVVYLYADRPVFIHAFSLRLVKAAVCRTDENLSFRLGGYALSALCHAVYLSIPVGQVCVEQFRYVLLFRRVRRVSGVRILFRA